MKSRIAATVIALLICCGCYDRFDAPQEGSDLPAPNMNIADLHDLWFGECKRIDSDITVGGRVTSSDRAGNFYRTFTIRDASGGMEILAGPTDLHNRYPVGCYVAVSLKGCAIDEETGVLQAGLPAPEYDYKALDYLQADVVLDSHIFRNDDIVPVDIPLLSIRELSTSLCGCPVTVEGLTCMRTDSDQWSGYARFEDGDGGVIYTYTSSYADFAEHSLPDGMVSVTGILQYGTVSREIGKQYILKMSDETDCRAVY